MKSKIKKTLYFTEIQFEMGSVKASMMGMSFNNWVKYLISKDLENFHEVDVASRKLDAEDKIEY